MRGTTIFVLASFILPAFAGPVPIQDTVVVGLNAGIEQRASETTAIVDHKVPRDLYERTPLIEAIPLEERSQLDVEDDAEEKRAIKRPNGGWGKRSNDNVERGTQRPKGGWGRAIQRPNGGWGKRSNDNVERGTQRPKSGWGKRSNDNVERGTQRPKGGWGRAIQRPNGGWGRRADDHVERGTQRPKSGWGKRSMAERIYAAI